MTLPTVEIAVPGVAVGRATGRLGPGGGELVWSSSDRSYGWQVAVAAGDYLESKADKLEAKARKLRAEAEKEALDRQIHGEELVPQETVEKAGLWHQQRADGARERAHRVDTCQQKKLVRVQCTHCNGTHEIPLSCDQPLLCSHCRGLRKVEVQGDFMRSREVAIDLAKSQGLLRGNAPGGAYGEKLLTLTLPHVSWHSVADRIHALNEAWPLFWREIKDFLNDFEGKHHPYLLRRGWWHFRRFEWTEGKDGNGHPHFHVWLLSPFLPAGLLIGAWRSALSRVRLADGVFAFSEEDLRSLLTPDIRKVYKSNRVRERRGNGTYTGGLAPVQKELIKYITKDFVEGKGRIPAETFARVYEAIDGRRLTQASRGFVAMGKRARVCPDCHQEAPAYVRVYAASPERLAELVAERRERRRARAAETRGGGAPPHQRGE